MTARRITLAPMTAISVPPTELVSIAAATGFDGIGVKIDGPPERMPFPILDDPPMLERLCRRLEADGMCVQELDTVTIGPAGPTIDVARALDAGGRLGATVLITLAADHDEDRLAEHLHATCAQAADVGLIVALEFVRFSTVGDIRTAQRLSRKVAHPSFRLALDLLHLRRSGGSLDDVLDEPELIGLIHACDSAAAEPANPFFEAVGDRLPPGEGELDVARTLAALASVPISVEVPSTRLLGSLGARGHAAACRAALERCLDGQSGR